MIDTLLEFLTWICLLSGGVFCLIGSIGMHRFPDVYSRMHAAGVTDTLGVGLVLLGLLLQAPGVAVAVKLVTTALFLWITSPTATHALAQSAHSDGIEPVLGDAPNPFEHEENTVHE